MYIEGREIPPFAEPAFEDDLELHEVYFSVHFVDTDMLVPEIMTMVYVGKDIEKIGDKKHYFQDISSHRQGVRFDNVEIAKPPCSPVFVVSECKNGKVNNIYSFSTMLNELLKCSLRQDQAR